MLQGTTGGAEPGETFMSDREVTYRVGFEVGHVVQVQPSSFDRNMQCAASHSAFCAADVVRSVS